MAVTVRNGVDHQESMLFNIRKACYLSLLPGSQKSNRLQASNKGQSQYHPCARKILFKNEHRALGFTPLSPRSLPRQLSSHVTFVGDEPTFTASNANAEPPLPTGLVSSFPKSIVF
jgi:hypothetical protein